MITPKINHIIIAGRLTAKPELKHTPSGYAVMRLCIAHNESKKDQQGNWQDIPHYIDCVIWGEYAEKIEPKLSKGLIVIAQGRLSTQAYQDPQGIKRKNVEVVINSLSILEDSKPAPITEPDSNGFPPDEQPF